MLIGDPVDLLERTLRRVREENKQLKKQLNYLRSGKYLNQVKWERDFNERMVEDLQNDLDAANSRVKELSERIIKAIEYIEENKDKVIAPYGDNEDTDYETCLDKDEIKKLLEILKGEPNNDNV